MAERWSKGLSQMLKVRKGSGKQLGGSVVVRGRGRPWPAKSEPTHEALEMALSGLTFNSGNS